MFDWLKRRIAIECDVDHEFYFDLQRSSKRQIADLNNIIKLKDITIHELNRHVEIEKHAKYDIRTP